MRKLLLLVLLLIGCELSYADTVSPYVIFGNGLRLESNEMADVMDTPKGLGLMFDGDDKTSWKYQKRDDRYGVSKQATLKIKSSRFAITSIKLFSTCGELSISALEGKASKLGESKSNASGELVLEVGGKNDFQIRISGGDVCISGMQIFAGKNELTKDASFIVSSGGGYSDVYFYSKHKWVDSFEGGNTTDFYFLEDGSYACFVLWMEIGPLGGVRIYNTKTLARLDMLEGQYLNLESIKWNGRTISGRLVKPNKNWAEEKFSIKVKFP